MAVNINPDATILDIVKHYKFLYDTPENAANCSPSEIMQCDADISPNNRTIIIRNELAKPPYFAIIGFDELNGASALSSYIREEYLKKKQMLLHEVLLDHRPRKLCIDFDHIKREYIDELEKELTEIGRAMHANLEYWHLYLSSIDGDKCGIHAVSYRAYCADAAQACAYQRAIVGKMSAEIRECVDGAFLRPKRTQNIRAIFSSKDGSMEKTKICLNPASTVLDSLVQYVNECEELPIIADDYQRGVIVYQNGITMEEPARKALNEWCNSHGFAIKNACGVGLINLVRVLPSQCEICKREHSSDGAYAIITKRNVRVRCRRADDEHTAGFIVIWASIDYRGAIVDPANKWVLFDIDKIDHKLTNAEAISKFQIFAQSTIAHIRGEEGETYYLFKRRDEGETRLIATHTLKNRGDVPFTIIDPEKKKEVKISFEQAVEMFAPLLIRYSRIDFIPYLAERDKVEPDVLNVWTGFRNGIGAINMEHVNPFLQHIRKIWCRNDEALSDYVVNWFAHLIQQPGSRTRTAIVVHGDQGTGKTLICEIIARCIGEQYYISLDIDRLVAKFNDYLMNKLLIESAETYHGEMSQTALESKLRAMITGARFMIERKGMPGLNLRDNMRIIFTSNSDLPLRVELTDRRYCILHCAEITTITDADYFDKLVALYEKEEALRSLFSYLATRNISNFNITTIPKNDARTRAKIESMSRSLQFLFEITQGGVDKYSSEEGEYVVSAMKFYDDFADWAKRCNFAHIPNARQFSNEVGKVMGETSVMKENGESYRGRRFTLAKLRQDMDRILKIK